MGQIAHIRHCRVNLFHPIFLLVTRVGNLLVDLVNFLNTRDDRVDIIIDYIIEKFAHLFGVLDATLCVFALIRQLGPQFPMQLAR